MINMGKLHYGNCNQMVADLNAEVNKMRQLVKEIDYLRIENEELKRNLSTNGALLEQLIKDSNAHETKKGKK